MFSITNHWGKQIKTTTKYHLKTVRMASDEKGISVGEDVEKRKPLFTVVGRSGGRRLAVCKLVLPLWKTVL